MSAPRLAPILGLREGLAMLVGIVIGVGILRTPGLIAGYLPSPWLILAAWAFGGVMVGLSSLVYAELATQLPRAGGKYVYARAAFGDTTGFMVGSAELLGIRAFTASAKIVVIGGYLASLIGGNPKFLGAVIVIGYLALHLRGLPTTARVQNWASLLKVTFLVTIIGLAFWHGNGASWTAPLLPPAGSLTLLAVALAFQSVWYTYSGWEDVVKMTEELREPGKMMPIVLLGGAALITFIYVGLNASFLQVLTPTEMTGSDFVARNALAMTLGNAAGTVLTIGGLLLLLGSINVNFISMPRIAFGLARDGLAPEPFLKLDEKGTPRAGVYLAIGVVLLLSAIGTVEWLIRIMSFVLLVTDGIVILALFRLRRTVPEAPRPFRVPLYPWLPILVAMMYAGILTLIAVSQPKLAAGGIGVLVLFFGIGAWRASEARSR